MPAVRAQPVRRENHSGAYVNRQLAFTIMSNWRDWRIVRIDTWNEGWDIRILCFSFRSESADGAQ